MKAITVEPKKAGSARLEEVAEPDVREGSVLVEAIAVGVCGTDVEIAGRKIRARPLRNNPVWCWAMNRWVGSLIPVPRADLKKATWWWALCAADAVPCPNCAVGEWDMCRNGQYTERGIKQIHGFMSERWRIEPEYAIKVDASLGLLGVLLEPTTVVAKAWEMALALGQRFFWEPRKVFHRRGGPHWSFGGDDRRSAGVGGARVGPR